MSDDANSLIREYEQLWSDQGNFRNLWNTAAQYVMPAWDNFVGEWSEGVNRNTRIFDSTAIIANERFSAAMESILTPRSQIWHKLKPSDESLEDNPAIQAYCDNLNKILFSARYHPEANFASQTDECYMSLGAFGNNMLFIDEVVGKCLRYRSIPLSELVWAINHQGYVDTFYRKFEFTAKQCMQMAASGQWQEGRVPQQVRNQYASNPFQKSDWLHCVKPNSEHVPGAYGDKGKEFESWYIHMGTRSIVSRGTYRVFPSAVGRYRVAPRENYGRGPATTCLPDIRTANEMIKTSLRAGQKAVDPPILLSEESILSNFNMRPGANNYGMMTADGKPLAMPFESKSNFKVQEEMITDTRSVIRDTFLNTLFQILVENPNMTATEALLRAQEKGELIAPMMGRQQSEFLGPLIRRELDILHDAGQLPPVPKELLESGKGIRVEYTSPLAVAQMAQEGTAIMNSINDLATMANLDRTVLQIIDLHDAYRQMAIIRGVPAKLIRTEDEVQALLEHQAEQAQQANETAAAPMVSQSVKNLAQAAQAASSAGQAQPGAAAQPGAQ